MTKKAVPMMRDNRPGCRCPQKNSGTKSAECRWRNPQRATSPTSSATRAASAQRFVNCLDQRLGARIDQQSRAHLVHGVAKSDPGVGIGEAQRAAGPGMAEDVRARPEG